MIISHLHKTVDKTMNSGISDLLFDVFLPLSIVYEKRNFEIPNVIAAVAVGFVFNKLAVLSRTHLKGPLDIPSRYLFWGYDGVLQFKNSIFYNKASPELKRKHFEVLKPVAEQLKAVVQRVFDIPADYWSITTRDAGVADTFASASGGYNVGIYHHMFPLAKNQAGLACVLGHEMGTVLAKHKGQSVSDAFFPIPFSFSLLAILPLLRARVSQADEIGIYLTALAGYDP